MNKKVHSTLKMSKPVIGCMLSVIGFGLVGCQEALPPLQAPTVTLPPNDFDPNVDAGWGKGVKVGDAKLVADLKLRNSGNHGQSFSPRNDPFALLAEERSFEAIQTSERFAQENGFSFDYEEPAPKDDTEVLEPQPYRRLAGVIVGESVLALIDMGDGRLEIIRPGQRIPNSEWTVVSIDEEKAILRRSGNKLPRQIVVRLESPPAGAGFNPGGGQGAGSPGAPGLGGPGAPPGSPRGGAPGAGAIGGGEDR